MPRFLLPIFVLTLLSLTGFGLVVLKLDPSQTSSVVLFLVTLFLSLTFGLSLLFFFVHKKFFFKPKAFTALGPAVSDDDLRPLFRTSLRQAVLVALLLTILLVLQRLR
jgi:hypothetical protein